ncbi:concanavalin A-like lectin/glucanase domain-containing protein [Mariannaea sp. PMI_226]|nr:concanavalin A-like lectin/glucanase domain-containing protein [Mariannaea sp. PMI_226]
MVPSILSVGTAALACIGGVSAKQWHLSDTYDATNFFDKFTFFSDSDPNGGHNVYQTREKATELGLAKFENGEVYLGPDTTNVLSENTGRPSVRLQSAITYNHGLFIARFSHLPKAACGSWPAFWTVGGSWPNDGEIDIIEGWNLQTTNAPAFHVGSSSKFGQCKLDGADQISTVKTGNCDNTFSDDTQFTNQGCTGYDTTSPYGSSEGGVYALEWTEEYIKLFAWKWDSVPANIDSSEPNTDSWGKPNMFLKNNDCNIDNHFIDQTIIINLAFCGNPVGNPDVWGAACKAKTGFDTCNAYVSAKPKDFAETYFKIKDIRYYKTVKSTTPSGSSSSSVSGHSSAAIHSTSTRPVVATTRRSQSSHPVVTSTAASAGSDAAMTTSVVYTTHVHTVTSCAPTVTNCPVGAVVTKTIALSTTICPVTEAQATATGSSPGSPGSNNDQPTTVTRTTTKVRTVTRCPASVTNCPATLPTKPVVAATTHSTSVKPVVVSSSSIAAVTLSSRPPSLSASSYWPPAAPSVTTSTHKVPTKPVETAAETHSAPPQSVPPQSVPPQSAPQESAPGLPTTLVVAPPVNTPVPTPATTPKASTGSSSAGSQSEVPVPGGASKMGVSFTLIIGVVAALMV